MYIRFEEVLGFWRAAGDACKRRGKYRSSMVWLRTVSVGRLRVWRLFGVSAAKAEEAAAAKAEGGGGGSRGIYTLQRPRQPSKQQRGSGSSERSRGGSCSSERGGGRKRQRSRQLRTLESRLRARERVRRGVCRAMSEDETRPSSLVPSSAAESPQSTLSRVTSDQSWHSPPL